MDYYEWMRLPHVLLPLVLSAAVSLHAQDTDAASATPKRSALNEQLFYELLLGELSALSDDAGAGFSLMLDAARKTSDPAVYQRAVEIALRARSGASALLAAKAWSQAIPDSREANRYVLNILLGLNRTAEALEPLKRSIALAPANERSDTLWAIPATFAHTSDTRLAASTVQKTLGNLLQDRELGPTAWAVVGRMWLRAGDKAAALNAADKGLSLDVHSEHAALLALSMIDPALPRAEQLVRLHLPEARAEFRMAYVKTLLGARRNDDAQVELQSITINHPRHADAWLVEGLIELQFGRFETAQQHLNHYLRLIDAAPDAQQHPEFRRGRTQAFFALAQIAQRQDDWQQADTWLQRVDNPEDVLQAAIRRATLMARQGNVDAALDLINSQVERTPDDARLKRSAQVQLLRDHQLFDRARSLLETAQAQNPDDLDLLYDLAMVNERLGRLDDMERLLRQLIARKPDDPQAYNALGYSLADRNLRLPEARQLISQALQLAPNDPFITDSLAWVEFRSGNHAEALRLLQNAFQSRPDAEIAAHLGEVLWTMARQSDAIEVFRQGLMLNPANDTLTNTLKRLNVPL